jgi:hypothetical protein
MRRGDSRRVWAVAVLVAGTALLLGACLGSGGGSTQSTTTGKAVSAARTTTVTTAQVAVVAGPADPYSTFRSKDPFIQQALPPSSTSTTQAAPTSTISSTTTSSTTSSSSTTSTTAGTTTTTSFFAHLLQILSVGTVEGSPAVTFQVDNTVYQNAHTGDVLSTSWGQFKVLDIDTASKTVTLLHGSETLILVEGQIVYE